jgi:hypothetical protein
MGHEPASTSFVDLRRLAEWFETQAEGCSARSITPAVSVERIVRRLGAVCIPLLGRELLSADARRREAARTALAQVAGDIRPRVIAELRRIANSDAPTVKDESKVCALGLLSELGERSSAKLTDPSAMQRRSALALATELDNPADVAAAADMMIQQLSRDEMLQLLEVMVKASAGAAYHLAVELCARLDLGAQLRERIAHIALGSHAPLPVHEHRAPRPPHVTVLVDRTGRSVVIACRKLAGERRWRRWAVLIGAHGGIDDCLHEDRAGVEMDHVPLVSSLVADGYEVASTDLDRARGLVAAAARHSAASSERLDRLPAAYYLGRDLLDLGEAHLGGRVHAHPTSATLGRAVELIADGDVASAHALLVRTRSPRVRRVCSPRSTGRMRFRYSPARSSSSPTSRSITGIRRLPSISWATRPAATTPFAASSRRARDRRASTRIPINRLGSRSHRACSPSSSAPPVSTAAR